MKRYSYVVFNQTMAIDFFAVEVVLDDFKLKIFESTNQLQTWYIYCILVCDIISKCFINEK